MPRPKREDGKNAKYIANNKYAAETYDRTTIIFRKGERARVAEYAKDHGYTTSGLVNALLADIVPGFRPVGAPEEQAQESAD